MKTIKALDFKVHTGLSESTVSLILFDPHHNVTQNCFRGNKMFVLNIAHYDGSSFLQVFKGCQNFEELDH